MYDASVEFLVSILAVYKSNEIPDDDKIPLPGNNILSIDAETAYKFFHFLFEAPKSNALLSFGMIEELKSAVITILSVFESPNVINAPPNVIFCATVKFPVRVKLDAEISPTKFMLPYAGALNGNNVYVFEPLPN